MSDKNYFSPDDLKNFSKITDWQEEYGKKFFDWYGSVFKEGALTEREKSLIALGVAHALQCPYCIDAYTSTCLEEGCDQDQIAEAIHVAAAMKAGITLVHGLQSKELSDKLTN